MLLPPTPLQTPMPTPLPGSADNSVYNNPTEPRDVPTPTQDVDEGDVPNTQHFVLAQFDKMTRTRWNCILKDGIMCVNDRDLLFNKATGEFDF